MDETFIKVHGQWVYLYRAVDKSRSDGRFLSEPEPGREGGPIVSASAMKNTGVLMKITWDGYAASHRAVERCGKTVIFRVASRFDPAPT
jgi:hypothetical protein